MRQLLAQQIEDEESEINITPMLDVVFIMLIFFIVTATFVKEAGIEVNRPDAATAVKAEKANILVAIGPNNDIWIDRRQVDIRSVRPNIERLHAENPQGSVVIQADKESKTDTHTFPSCVVGNVWVSCTFLLEFQTYAPQCRKYFTRRPARCEKPEKLLNLTYRLQLWSNRLQV